MAGWDNASCLTVGVAAGTTAVLVIRVVRIICIFIGCAIVRIIVIRRILIGSIFYYRLIFLRRSFGYLLLEFFIFFFF